MGDGVANVIRPELFWLSFISAYICAAVVAAFRLRRSCIYMQLAHSHTVAE